MRKTLIILVCALLMGCSPTYNSILNKPMKSFLRPIRGWQGHFIEARSQIFENLPIDINLVDEVVVIDMSSDIDDHYYGFVYINDSTYYSFSKQYRDSLTIRSHQKIGDTEASIIENLHKNDIEAIIKESEANRVTSGQMLYITHAKRNEKGKFETNILKVHSFFIDHEIEKFLNPRR